MPLGGGGEPDLCAGSRSSKNHSTQKPIPTNNRIKPSALGLPSSNIEYAVSPKPTAIIRTPLRRSDQAARRRINFACSYIGAVAGPGVNPRSPRLPFKLSHPSLGGTGTFSAHFIFFFL